MVTGDGRDVLCLGSTAVAPPLVYRLNDGWRTLVTKDVLPGNFPSAQLVVPKQVIFKSAGRAYHPRPALPAEEPVQARPRDHLHAWWSAAADDARLPLTGFLQLLLREEPVSRQPRLHRPFSQLPARHHVWPGVPGSAKHFWRGAAEYTDVLAGARYLQSLPTVDPKRIGLWGGSYGGFLTAMGLARNSDVFVAGVDYAGVHDWVRDNPAWEAAPDLAAAKALATSSSPNAYVSTWKSPVLVVAGDDDRNVAFNQSVTLVQKLRAQGVVVEQIVYPDEVHDLLLWRDIVGFFNATNTFFQRHLQP